MSTARSRRSHFGGSPSSARGDSHLIYLNGQYTARGGRRGPRDAVAIEQHLKRREARRDQLAKRAERRRRERSQAEAEKLKHELHKQYVGVPLLFQLPATNRAGVARYLQQVRKEQALSKYWSRRDAGLPDDEYDGNGNSLAARKEKRLQVLVGGSSHSLVKHGHVASDDDLDDDYDSGQSAVRSRRGEKHSRRKAKRKHRRRRSSPQYSDSEDDEDSHQARRRSRRSKKKGGKQARGKGKANSRQPAEGYSDDEFETAADGGHVPAPLTTAASHASLRRHSTVLESDRETDGGVEDPEQRPAASAARFDEYADDNESYGSDGFETDDAA